MDSSSILKIIHRNKGRFKLVSCLFLDNGKCRIYSRRPKCCRNYPAKKFFCSKEECEILKKNTKEPREVCVNCREKCCEKILVPIDAKVSEEFLIDWLNIDCETCDKYFSKYYKFYFKN